MAKTVLITDGETRAALAMARSLGRAGYVVYVSSPERNSLAGTSRYCAGEFPQSTVRDGPPSLRRSLTSLIDALDPDVVLGVSDRSVTVLHEISRATGRELPPPDRIAYERASDKTRLFEDCLQMGIRVPGGIMVPGGQLPDRPAIARLGSAFAVRPGLSWRIQDTRWIHGRVTLENDYQGLERRLREDPALQYPYLVQEQIEGVGCGLFLLANHGIVHLVFAHQRVRERPPWGGVSTVCRSVAPPEDLMAAAKKYVETLRFSGLAMFEFRRVESLRTPYLLEINARPWGSMALATEAGIDFATALLSVSDALPLRDTAYRAGATLRWWWGDVDHFYLRGKEEGRSRAGAMVRALLTALGNGPWTGAWDSFQRHDPVPFLVESLRWVKNVARPQFGDKQDGDAW